MNKTMKSTIFLAGAVCVLLPLCSLTQSIGYQPAFLGTGFDVPLPTFSDSLIPDVLTAKELPGTSFQNGTYTKYIHFSIATNKRRRQPIVVALCVVFLSRRSIAFLRTGLLTL